jgi:hypothetical protein
MAEQPKALPDPCPADDPISNRPITLAQAGIDKHLAERAQLSRETKMSPDRGHGRG